MTLVGGQQGGIAPIISRQPSRWVVNKKHFNGGGAVACIPVKQQPLTVDESVWFTFHQVREVQVCFNAP